MLTIDTLKSLRDADALRDKVNANNTYELWLITRGGGSIQIDMQLFEVQQQHVYCIAPSQLSQLHVSPSAEGYVIRLTEQVMKEGNKSIDALFQANLLHAIGRSACMGFDEPAFSEVLHVVEQLKKEYLLSEAYQSELIMQYLNILFIYMGRKCRKEHETNSYNSNQRLFNRFISLVDKKFKTCKRVSEYADLLLVTPNHLNHAVRNTAGNTAGHYIRQRVVLEAKRQAVYSDCSMKELAWELGFQDIYHFSKFFKKETGDNFTTFKKDRTNIAVMVP